MEFWNGWFDHWGEKHTRRPAEEGENAFAPEYEKMIARGAHVNLYMFHGGTNFGFTAGANGSSYTDYAPTVTSYDYDCPLSEAGDPTAKYLACQRMARHFEGDTRPATRSLLLRQRSNSPIPLAVARPDTRPGGLFRVGAGDLIAGIE